MIAPLLALVMSASTPARGDPRAVVTAMFDAFNRHDAAALARLYAPDARLTSPDYCAPRGRADIASSYDELFTQFPDIRDEVELMVVESDRIAVRFRAVSAAGKLSLPIQAMLRVHNGLIVEDDSLFDSGGQPCR